MTTPHACLSCHSKDLCFGAIQLPRSQQLRFWPNSVAFWWGPYVHAFVCLECGYLGHYLSADSLRRLKSSHEGTDAGTLHLTTP